LGDEDIRQVRVGLVGLGATGTAIGRAVQHRRDCRVVCAVDTDPHRAGRELGALLLVPDLPARVGGDLTELLESRPDVAIVATTSLLTDLAPTALELLTAGINVVSICEELSFPYLSHPQLACQLDRAARDAGVTLLGTGVNPGLLMDTLPLALSALMVRVHRIEIRRATDMSDYSGIVSKFGLGLAPDEFTRQVTAGRVVGHHGFAQSLARLGTGLGLDIDNYDVRAPEPAVLAAADRPGAHLTLRAGTVAVMKHEARAMSSGRVVIDLSVHFGFLRPGDAVAPSDRWRVEGEPRDIELAAPAGVESFHGTVAVTSNVVAAVVGARPGLITMADLPVTAMASKGRLLP
jgi:2,4-diaminopentanoate dehydrogenase